MKKRIVLEWGLIFSVGVALAVSTLWVVSRFFVSSSYCLEFTAVGHDGEDLILIVVDGDLSLSNGFDMDAYGNFRPLVLGPPVGPDILRGDRRGQFTVAGLDFQYYLLAPWNNWVWSLKLSLLIPAVLFSMLALLFFHRFKRLRRYNSRG